MYRLFLSSLLLIVTSAAPVLSQEDDKHFYEKDYAKNPLDDKSIDKTKTQNNKVPTATKTATETDTKIVPNTQTDYRPVLSLSAVIECSNAKYCDEKLRELATVSDKYKFLLNRIFLVDSKGVSSDVIGKYWKSEETLDFATLLSQVIEVTAKVPERFKVSFSPAWLVEVEEGWIVLEGESSLDSYFSPEGKFIDSYPKEKSTEIH